MFLLSVFGAHVSITVLLQGFGDFIQEMVSLMKDVRKEVLSSNTLYSRKSCVGDGKCMVCASIM